MKDRDGPPLILPRRLRTYLTFNLVVAVFMAVVLAVRMELRTGRFLLIDYLLFGFYTLVLSSIFFGPLGVVETYLYRRKKGVWYAWTTRLRYRRDRFGSPEERRYWKNAAILARLSRKDEAEDLQTSRTGLFARSAQAESVSRAEILMRVADRFQRTGKREAADRCYREVIERFSSSSQATEAARRLEAASTERPRD